MPRSRSRLILSPPHPGCPHGARIAAWVICAFSLGLTAVPALADAVYQPLPFAQNWANTSLITVNDDWSGVPGIVGFRGDNPTGVSGVDPQTVLGDDLPGVIDVNANQTNPLVFATGGSTEFEAGDPVVALTGSGTADAPYLVLHVDAGVYQDIHVIYHLVDMEGVGSVDDAIQPVALQFRTTGSGPWTNVPAGYVADATVGPGLPILTNVSVTLPATANFVATLQIRVITTNAVGNDEWVGVDDISVTGTPIVFADATIGPLGDANVGSGTAWGDYDNDGDLDLFLANYQAGANKLFRNDGLGNWVDATSSVMTAGTGGGRAAAWGDYDNDGDLDLYHSRFNTNQMFRNDAGTWTNATTAPLGDAGAGNGIAWGDFDRDGDLDLYLVNGIGAPNKLFRNDVGTWADATTGPLAVNDNGTGVAAGDYDNDGDLDLYVANWGGSNKLLRNDGASWVDATSGALVGQGQGANGVAWGDYDNDGDLDLCIANQNPPQCRLMRNDAGTWVNVTSGPLTAAGTGFGVAWADYDNDGDLDLYLSRALASGRLFRNDAGVWVDATAGPIAEVGDGRGAAWGDYDNDGDLDLYLVNTNLANKLYRNDIANGNHWLHAKLVGTVSNRSAIGARARIVANGVSHIEEVSGGSGFLSQNSLDVEFGLGAATSIDSLIVRWPSGIVWDTTGVAVDQRLTIVERSNVLGVDEAPARPATLELSAVVPNPIRRAARINYTLPAQGWVRLTVHDLQGRQVATLADGAQAPGRHSVTWNAATGERDGIRAGIYFVRLATSGEIGVDVRVGKLVVAR